MVVEKILGSIEDYELGSRRADRVFLEWFEADKKLLHKQTESGMEIGIRVNQPLKDGDILYVNSERIIFVEILPTELICVKVETMLKMGRLCFELGNRHLQLDISEDEVRVPYDAPTFEYLEKLGFNPLKVRGKVSHLILCHSHRHSH